METQHLECPRSCKTFRKNARILSLKLVILTLDNSNNSDPVFFNYQNEELSKKSRDMELLTLKLKKNFEKFSRRSSDREYIFKMRTINDKQVAMRAE